MSIQRVFVLDESDWRLEWGVGQDNKVKVPGNKEQFVVRALEIDAHIFRFGTLCHGDIEPVKTATGRPHAGFRHVVNPGGPVTCNQWVMTCGRDSTSALYFNSRDPLSINVIFIVRIF